MANRSILKGYFEAGDRPTANQFGELIDNVVNVDEDKANDLEALDASNDSKYITPKKTRTIVDPLLVTKEPSITNGTANQYWNGVKQFKDFQPDVRNTSLTGLIVSSATNLTLLASDKVLEAFGKIMAQFNSIQTQFNSIQTQFANYRLRTQYITLNNDRTLSNNTSLQQIFNSPSNGAFTLVAGKRYKFKCDFLISGMSATSGTFSFGLVTSLTATDVEIAYNALAVKSSSPSQAQFCSSTSIGAQILVTASSNAQDGSVSITGIIKCFTAGTIAPGIALSVAPGVNNAKIKKNSYFEIEEIGDNANLSNGAWS